VSHVFNLGVPTKSRLGLTWQVLLSVPCVHSRSANKEPLRIDMAGAVEFPMCSF
jgi:hypothetical protein